MRAIHDAQSKHNDGDVNGARNAVNKARSQFEAAKGVAGKNTQAKIGNAIGVLDGLSGGITDDTRNLPDVDQFLPEVPKPIQQAVMWILMQTIQVLDPTQGWTEPGKVMDRWMDAHGLNDPVSIAKFIEDDLVARNKKKD